jgi:hypothetical protein
LLTAIRNTARTAQISASFRIARVAVVATRIDTPALVAAKFAFALDIPTALLQGATQVLAEPTAPVVNVAACLALAAWRALAETALRADAPAVLVSGPAATNLDVDAVLLRLDVPKAEPHRET